MMSLEMRAEHHEDGSRRSNLMGRKRSIRLALLICCVSVVASSMMFALVTRPGMSGGDSTNNDRGGRFGTTPGEALILDSSPPLARSRAAMYRSMINFHKPRRSNTPIAPRRANTPIAPRQQHFGNPEPSPTSTFIDFSKPLVVDDDDSFEELALKDEQEISQLPANEEPKSIYHEYLSFQQEESILTFGGGLAGSLSKLQQSLASFKSAKSIVAELERDDALERDWGIGEVFLNNFKSYNQDQDQDIVGIASSTLVTKEGPEVLAQETYGDDFVDAGHGVDVQDKVDEGPEQLNQEILQTLTRQGPHPAPDFNIIKQGQNDQVLKIKNMSAHPKISTQGLDDEMRFSFGPNGAEEVSQISAGNLASGLAKAKIQSIGFDEVIIRGDGRNLISDVSAIADILMEIGGGRNEYFQLMRGAVSELYMNLGVVSKCAVGEIGKLIKIYRPTTGQNQEKAALTFVYLFEKWEKSIMLADDDLLVPKQADRQRNTRLSILYKVYRDSKFRILTVYEALTVAEGVLLKDANDAVLLTVCRQWLREARRFIVKTKKKARRPVIEPQPQKKRFFRNIFKQTKNKPGK